MVKSSHKNCVSVRKARELVIYYFTATFQNHVLLNLSQNCVTKKGNSNDLLEFQNKFSSIGITQIIVACTYYVHTHKLDARLIMSLA